MEIISVKFQKKVKYPKIETVIQNQNILRYNIPYNWKRKEALYLTLTAFLFNCSHIRTKKDYINSENVYNDIQPEKMADQENLEYNYNSDKISVAPVFIHGTGYGSGGCVSVAPAVYLTENEALSVIEDEFEKAGISFRLKDYVTDAKYIINNTIENKWKEINHLGDRIEDNIETNITLDLYNTELNLGIEFFGQEGSDVFDENNGYWSSVWSFNAKAAAQKARDVMEDYGKINFGVFYDPAVASKDKKYSIGLLKKQIHDFLEWYKYNSNN